MRKKIIFILLTVALISGLGTHLAFSKEEKKATVDSAAVTRKLDAVLANQAAIFKEFEQIKQELQIIKIRASRR